MSSTTWTPGELLSETQFFSGRAWRIATTQESTEEIVDELGEQEALRGIIEEEVESYLSLHFLLRDPLRFGVYPEGSRFRRAGRTRGVWYGAERAGTAAIEMAFYRSLSYVESGYSPFLGHADEYVAFLVDVETDAALDLTRGAMSRDKHLWEHPTDYGPCQQLADSLREIDGELIRYASVRDRNGGMNIAVLSPRAFASREPIDYQTWSIHLVSSEVRVICKDDGTGFEFSRDASSGEVDWDNPKAI